MKTIKQIADECQVTKQQVYRYIKNNNLEAVSDEELLKHSEALHEAHQKTGAKYYSEAVETLIKQAFAKKTTSSEALHEAHQEAVNEAPFEVALNEDHIATLKKYVETLETQLKEKDKQINELHILLAQKNDDLRLVGARLVRENEENKKSPKWWQFWANRG